MPGPSRGTSPSPRIRELHLVAWEALPPLPVGTCRLSAAARGLFLALILSGYSLVFLIISDFQRGATIVQELPCARATSCNTLPNLFYLFLSHLYIRVCTRVHLQRR